MVATAAAAQTAVEEVMLTMVIYLHKKRLLKMAMVTTIELDQDLMNKAALEDKQVQQG